MNLDEELAQGAARLHCHLSEEALHKLCKYLALVQKWNRVYNLTAVRERRKMLSHHLLDCLAVVPHVAAASIVDVGTGAGLPGIPLALAMPQARVTLLDSNQKKAAFLRQAAIELAITNVEIVSERVETWEAPSRFDLVISRAFSTLRDFLAAASRLCVEGGTLASMKGVHPFEELAEVPAEFRVRDVIALDVPGLQAQRHLILLQRAS